MNEDTTQIQREIDAEITALAGNLSELEAKAREITDWRAQVRKHPLATVGVALASGVAIAMLTGRRRPGTAYQPESGAAAPGPSPLSHPVVDRVLNALVAVAAGKAVEILGDMIPEFSGHLAKDDPAAVHTNGATTPPEFAERRFNTGARPS